MLINVFDLKYTNNPFNCKTLLLGIGGSLSVIAFIAIAAICCFHCGREKKRFKNNQRDSRVTRFSNVVARMPIPWRYLQISRKSNGPKRPQVLTFCHYPNIPDSIHWNQLTEDWWIALTAIFWHIAERARIERKGKISTELFSFFGLGIALGCMLRDVCTVQISYGLGIQTF